MKKKQFLPYESPSSVCLMEEVEHTVLVSSGDDLPDWSEEGVNGNDDF
ncbi:MAG: hypothetical protein IJR34_04960 [Bacteroidales bacterium]|nr:hypothetical protein [Bacteroidales bacterium]